MRISDWSSDVCSSDLVLHILTFGEPPALDELNRPRFAYGRIIHENCERRPHYDAGRFALEFGDAGHRQGFCLYKIGCKGPETHANCPAIGFGEIGRASCRERVCQYV